MSLVAEQAKFLLHVGELVRWATTNGFTVTGGELWRTPEQQKIYVQTGRSKTLNSYHLRRLAIDLNFFKDGELVQGYKTLAPIGVYWKLLDPANRWGGNFANFKDLPHFERAVK